MEKLQFEYSGTDVRGAPMTGSLKAGDLAEAQALAKRLGCLNPVVTPYNPHSARKQAIPEPTAGSVQPVSVPPQILPERSPGMPRFEPEVAVYESGPKMEDNSRLAAMVSGIKENVQRQLDCANVKIRQVLIIGEQPVVSERVNSLLLKHSGKVVSVNMHPNHHGIMVFAVVVEHETYGHENAKEQ